MFDCFKSKAQKISQIRKQGQWFLVAESFGMFGDFSGYYTLRELKEERVFARTHREAAERYARRNYTDPPGSPLYTKQFAKYRVRRCGKPNHKRYYRFFK